MKNALLQEKDAQDPMQCDLCGKITDLMEAETRRKLRHTELGNSLRTDQTQWQCKHCLAWNES